MKKDLKSTYADTLMRPRVTEKASMLMEKNVYVFEISKNASKTDVLKAMEVYYKVSPVKVCIAKNPSKNVFVRGKKGVKSGVKKAYVYLKEGDKIE